MRPRLHGTATRLALMQALTLVLARPYAFIEIDTIAPTGDACSNPIGGGNTVCCTEAARRRPIGTAGCDHDALHDDGLALTDPASTVEAFPVKSSVRSSGSSGPLLRTAPSESTNLFDSTTSSEALGVNIDSSMSVRDAPLCFAPFIISCNKDCAVSQAVGLMPSVAGKRTPRRARVAGGVAARTRSARARAWAQHRGVRVRSLSRPPPTPPYPCLCDKPRVLDTL